MARFLLEDVRDFLAGHIQIDLGNQSLFGHSFGGLFALWLMFTQPDAFRNVIASSPAITWEDSFLLDHLSQFTPLKRALRVHLSAGEWEGDHLAPFQANSPEVEARLAEKARIRTVGAAQEMAAALTKQGVETAYETYADETHMSVLPVAVNRALRWAFSVDRSALPLWSDTLETEDK
jgi:predicted alpha/beta superfamily hydrolase